MPRTKLEDGLYDELVSSPLAAQIKAAREARALVVDEPLDAANAHEILGRYVGRWLARALAHVPEKDRPTEQLALANRALELVSDLLRTQLPPEAIETPLEARRLVAVLSRGSSSLEERTLPRIPATPLGTSDLLTNAREERSVGRELAVEMESAETVDLVCAFLKVTGFARMRDAFRAHLVMRRRPLRVLTTTYLGGTDREVLDELTAMGAEVKVSYDTSSTRLHAKAWLFERRTEFSTAYIGSSNMSVAAMSDGLEWNVRVSAVESPAVLAKFRKTFETYWADPYFEAYDPVRDGTRFSEAARLARGGGRSASENLDTGLAVHFDVQPYPFQKEILERLDAERNVHGRTRTLVVAATGTGKTVIAALDYRRLRDELGDAPLLFVAHRAEILKQSQAVFRAVLRETDFGERLFEGERPKSDRHLFASIQSLEKRDLASMAPDCFDVVIVDEFHHAAAKTYQTLLTHFRPRYLVGLTATPERADGRDVLSWFDGRIAAELRLWDAIERGLLVPFQYFGVADVDSADLRRLQWRRGKYEVKELENLYTGDHARVRLIANALRERVLVLRRMRALGFCVSVAHAKFMAAELTKLGIPSLAVTGEDDSDARRSAINRLVRREVNVLFTVDVFSEGVDIPDVDTVLFLRPTESATVFLQQLGRGLRRADNKGVLTVLDFIGEPHERFRFDLRYRALTNAPSGKLANHVEEGFPLLPSGCSVQLDPVAQQRVLRNVKRAVTTATRELVSDLRQAGRDVSLGEFLDRAGIGLEHVYRGRGAAQHWRGLRELAGLPVAPLSPDRGDDDLLASVDDLIAFDDPECLRLWLSALREPRPPRFDPDEMTRRRWQMLAVTFDKNSPGALASFLKRLWSPAVRDELVALFAVLADRVGVRPVPLELPSSPPVPPAPLMVHCRYSLVQILAAFDDVKEQGRVVQPQQGVYLEKKTRSDLLFVTLKKSERDYSPTTMYRDYAISETEFHWESQNHAVPKRSPGNRHVDPRAHGVTPILFVRETKKDARGLTAPYEILGPVDVLRWRGERPIQVVWKLRVPMTAAAFAEARVVA